MLAVNLVKSSLPVLLHTACVEDRFCSLSSLSSDFARGALNEGHPLKQDYDFYQNLGISNLSLGGWPPMSHFQILWLFQEFNDILNHFPWLKRTPITTDK